MGKWERVIAGYYRRVGSDGKTVLASVHRHEGAWHFEIYPDGKRHLSLQYSEYRTLTVAKSVAEVMYRAQVAKLRRGEPIG